MSKNTPPDPSNDKQKVDPLNPPNLPLQGQAPADLRPTAAEYERDATLDREKEEEAAKKVKAQQDAVVAGDLPPAAQSLEDARAQRQKAKDDEEKARTP